MIKRALYISRKENHLCIDCGEPAWKGVRCKKCTLYHADNAANSYRIKRDQRLAEGLCVVCGKEKPKPGTKCCYTCLSKSAAATMRYQRKQKEKKQNERNTVSVNTSC